MVTGGPPTVSTGAARAARADPRLWGRTDLSPRPLLAPRVEAHSGLCCEVRGQREQPVEEGEGGAGSMSHKQLACRRSKRKRGLAIELARATIASPHDHEEQSSCCLHGSQASLILLDVATPPASLVPPTRRVSPSIRL